MGVNQNLGLPFWFIFAHQAHVHVGLPVVIGTRRGAVDRLHAAFAEEPPCKDSLLSRQPETDWVIRYLDFYEPLKSHNVSAFYLHTYQFLYKL